jgi:MFS transporter, DHA1 family, tetracycline resistance protein
MRKLIPILFLSFVNVIGFSILIPVLPEILIQLTGESSGLLYGLLLSSYALSQFVAAPVLGSISDRYGRRPILLLSQFGTILSWIIFAAAYFIPRDAMIGTLSLPLLVIALSRITDGITGGNIAVAQAWVSDMTTAKEKTRAFGLVGATFGFGFMAGPALGGFSVSTSIGFLGTALLALFISLIAFAFIFWGLPESLSEENKTKKDDYSIRENFNFVKKFNLFKDNNVIKNLLWVRVFFSLAFVGFTTAIILFLGRTYDLSPVQIGLVMSGIGVFSILNQAVIVPKFDKKFGSFKTFFIGLFLTSVVLSLHTLLPVMFETVFVGKVIFVFFFLSFFLNLGISMIMTTFKTIITTNTAENKQGQATGLDESISSFGQGVSPLFAGVLYDVIGFWSFALYGGALLIFSARAYYRCLLRR